MNHLCYLSDHQRPATSDQRPATNQSINDQYDLLVNQPISDQ
jgi:hypothetical protein